VQIKKGCKLVRGFKTKKEVNQGA